MANDRNDNDSQWVDERLRALSATGEFQPDLVRARTVLRDLENAPRRRVGGVLIGAAIASLVMFLLPWPRAVAQQLWNRWLVGRVEVVQVSRDDLPESITAALTMEPRPFDREGVHDLAEAERVLGFRPSLPPAGLLNGTPKLSVVKTVTLATRPLNIADIQRALAAAGVSDIKVPREWEGTTLVAEAGPVLIAEYEGVEVMQSAPFRMSTPSGFQFGRFMEMAFRVFGRSADEARRLGEKFEANPALVMHFPEHEPVHDVALRSGQGVIVGDPDGSDGICFFWNTPDRIYIVSAAKMSLQTAAALAHSVR